MGYLNWNLQLIKLQTVLKIRTETREKRGTFRSCGKNRKGSKEREVGRSKYESQHELFYLYKKRYSEVNQESFSPRQVPEDSYRPHLSRTYRPQSFLGRQHRLHVCLHVYRLICHEVRDLYSM